MEFLNSYFRTDDDGNIVISDQQGSDFAKNVASDFNPIHDVGSKRFCVPGDLLFAIALSRYGLYQKMSFRFLDMVKAESELVYPDNVGDDICYANGKSVLGLEASGDRIVDATMIENVLRQYVAFSGQNFPHILVPLMEKHNVMINPARPLVIYESMSFELERLEFQQLQIKLADTSLEVEGKRGVAKLNFSFQEGETEVGKGSKTLVLSGLRPYEADVMQSLCDQYMAIANHHA